ncbi:glycosyltransferase [Haloferula sp.]|uniref:glycosyltransferase n=1 Tax=Haloferula sp. TaxID=2497595 RepID=UPI003C72B2B8
MVRVVDAWVARTGRTDVFAQIGKGGWEPSAMPFATMLDPAEFKKRFTEADVIIGHAGMGTILSALHFGKPILVMPKKASLGEQRNEHQLATARRMKDLGKVNVAFDEEELSQCLDQIDTLMVKDRISPFAGSDLIEGLRGFIRSGS